jgi:hypothetical protein
MARWMNHPAGAQPRQAPPIQPAQQRHRTVAVADISRGHLHRQTVARGCQPARGACGR